MIQTTITSCRTPTAASQISRLLGATWTAAFLAIAGLSVTGSVQPVAAQLAAGQASAPLDTTKLPRPAAIRQLAAFPQTTIILSADTVPAAARAALTLLEADGWQRYTTPRAQVAQQPTSETYMLKKEAQCLTLLVQSAPAHNNATSISYTALPIERDLPFPAKARDIRFAPQPLHLDATAPQTHESLLAFYRAELAKSGWGLHSASDGSAPMQVATGAAMHHAFFTHPAHGALHVTAKSIDGATSTVAVRAVPASVLPGAQAALKPEPAAAQPNPQATAHAQMSQQMDAMAQDLLKQALQSPPKAGSLEGALAAARSAGVRIDMPGKAQPTNADGVAPATEAANEPALERDEIGGLPVPKGASSRSQERTTWRTEVSATIRAGAPNVMAFYRRELGALGWRETTSPKDDAGRTVVTYTSAEGPAVLTLERKGRETTVKLLLRKEAEARKSGLMPKAGQAKIMFGSMLDADSTVLIAGRTIKIAAGVGSKTPDGPFLDVAPGAHRVTIRSPGKPDVVETVTVRADDIWGVLLGPGGALPLPMY